MARPVLGPSYSPHLLVGAGGGYPPQHNIPFLGTDTPKGLQAIYASCRAIYPDQPNPLQVTAVVKYWLDGPDPLDYISMYANHGQPNSGIPPHWHYISFGLSDLHGDGRVHENMGSDGPSGFGFELTFRLRRELGETAPPTWPAALLQALARYVFTSGNLLYAGDHIPWHTPLDGSDSRIQHMLIADDPQLRSASTPHGSLSFLQVVGVCAEELKAAQHWNGPGVIDFIKTIPIAGGPWLITDMRRGETIFDIDPRLQDHVDDGIEFDGSNLSGVSGFCSWEATPSSFPTAGCPGGLREPSEGTRPRCSTSTTAEDDDKENSRWKVGGVAGGGKIGGVASGSKLGVVGGGSKVGGVTGGQAGGGSKMSGGGGGKESSRKASHEVDRRQQLSAYESDQIKETLKKGLGGGGAAGGMGGAGGLLPAVLPSIKMSDSHQSDIDRPRTDKSTCSSSHRPEEEEAMKGRGAGGRRGVKEGVDDSVDDATRQSSDILHVTSYHSVHVKLKLESGALLPLALRGRLKHGRHFTFKNAMDEYAVTLVPTTVSGSIVNETTPYAAHDSWLQILLTNDCIDEMLNDVAELSDIRVVCAYINITCTLVISLLDGNEPIAFVDNSEFDEAFYLINLLHYCGTSMLP